MMEEEETFRCRICRKEKKKSGVVPAGQVPGPIADLIRREYPAWSPDGYICTADLNRFRAGYAREVLKKERSELSLLEEDAQKSEHDHELLIRNINAEYDRQLTLGERVSDRFAEFAGSWTFIAVFGILFFLWIVMNSLVLLFRPFDPYPYILLNLVLSAIAAVQAPVIIMSQNRQEARDRMHAERDYEVSIHSEMEIHQLHKKIDHLLTGQGPRLMEIQEIQLGLMEDLGRVME